MKTGIELIAIERQEQITKHEYSIDDDAHANDYQQLALAAIRLIDGSLTMQSQPPSDWDNYQWERMIRKSYKERLIIAGALIAAEIDRIQYRDA